MRIGILCLEREFRPWERCNVVVAERGTADRVFTESVFPKRRFAWLMRPVPDYVGRAKKLTSIGRNALLSVEETEGNILTDKRL